MSKLNRLYNVEKNTFCYQMHQKWGDNLLKVCPSIQWSLVWPLVISFNCALRSSLTPNTVTRFASVKETNSVTLLTVTSSVTRLGDLLDLRQVFEAFGNN